MELVKTVHSQNLVRLIQGCVLVVLNLQWPVPPWNLIYSRRPYSITPIIDTDSLAPSYDSTLQVQYTPDKSVSQFLNCVHAKQCAETVCRDTGQFFRSNLKNSPSYI